MATRNISVLALYNDKKEILLQHRSKDAPRLPDYWGFFGGGIEGSETPEQCLAREVLEELEYPVSAAQLLFIQKFTYKGDQNTKYIFVEKYDPVHPLIQHEGQGMRWFKIEDLNDLLIVDHDRAALSEVEKFLHNGNKQVSTQFSDPLLVGAYDAINFLGADGDFWLQQIEKLSPQTIIDLGCGTGLLTCELAERGYTMIGVDPSGPMLEVAQKKPYADKVLWIKGGHEKLEGLQADIVLMTSHVAQFFLEDKEWEGMLNASYEALKSGGYILFDSRPPIFPPYQTWPTQASPKRVQDPTLGPIDWYYKLLGIEGNRVRNQLFFHFIDLDKHIVSPDELIFRSREEITKSLEGAGFEIEKVYGDWDGSSVTQESPEMIFIAKRI